MADKIATRQAYGEALIELVEKNDKVVVLDADLANATQTCKVAKAHPEKFYNFGIAEANMVDAAAGMSTMGLVPFCSTFAMFAAGRAYEQIRNSVAYPHFNVKICATHAGVSVGEDGGSHQAIEDMGILRTIPNMTVIMPADYYSARKLVRAAAEFDGPVYLRFTRDAIPVIYDEEDSFVIGKAKQLRQGKDVAIIANGDTVRLAIQAAEELAAQGIEARVLDMHTIKPLDTELVLKAAQETGAIVTTEEANVLGGLGSAVCEYLSEVCPVPVIRHGVNDEFGRSGKAERVLEHFGLSPEGIAAKVRQALELKK